MEEETFLKTINDLKYEAGGEGNKRKKRLKFKTIKFKK